MTRLRSLRCLAFLCGLALAPSAWGQSDYRNLAPGRPITMEDAQPIEFRALELELGVPRFTREDRGQWVIGLEPEFKWGLAKDTEFGVSTELVTARESDGRQVTTVRDTVAHLLYNFNQETRRWPAFAVRPELAVRGGSLGSQHEHGSLKVIASKTIHRNRLHFNSSYAVGPTEERGRGGDLVSRYLYGAAYERTFPLKFAVLLADVFARRPIDGSPTQVVWEVGTRVQVTPVLVLDGGVSSGVLRRSAGPDFGVTFGLSYTFSFRSLFPTGPASEARNR